VLLASLDLEDPPSVPLREEKIARFSRSGVEIEIISWETAKKASGFSR